MKKHGVLLTAAAALTCVLFFSAGIIAGDFPDTIKMNTKEYAEHSKGIVEFTHAKHVDEHKVGCGECHHDKDHKPLAELKRGDAVQRCIECHNKPGEVKGKEAKALSDAQKLEYHANALHDNCKGCHKKYNKENNTKAAPTTCSKCHPRKS